MASTEHHLSTDGTRHDGAGDDAPRRRRTARRGVAALGLLVCLGGLLGCADDEDSGTDTATTEPAPAEDAGAEVERFNEPEGPVEVAVGQQFEIALLTEPTEGYTWQIDSIDPDGVISLQDSRPNDIPGDSEGDLTDGAGEDVFFFVADAAGTATITLTQSQAYPGGSTLVPERTVEVVVGE